tara:strand:- start:585 stop:4715 length:4131 start_codon:yes stop_codon:yes gene_type:complete
MAVVRQTQRVFNKPIGVTRMNTGEAELWQTVSNAASTINNIAMDYEKTIGVSQAQEAALGVARDDVISIDPSTGKPVALKIAEQYGSIRSRAFTDIINRRFQESISNEITIKGIDYATKYPSSSAFNQEMSRYVQDLVDSSDGMYSEFIQETGTVYIAKATKTLQSAEKTAAKKSVTRAADFSKQSLIRKAKEHSAAGGDPTVSEQIFKEAATAIQNAYDVGGTAAQYFASLDELNLGRAQASVAGLEKTTSHLSESQLLTVSAAIENPLSIGLLTGSLAHLAPIVSSIHSNANYKGLDKLSALFDGLVVDQQGIDTADFNAKIEDLIDRQTVTDQVSARGFFESNVNGAAVNDKDAAAKASLRLPARVLNKSVMNFLASSTTDSDHKTVTAILASLNGKDPASKIISQIPVASLRADVEYILREYTPEEIDIIIADVDKGFNLAASLDQETHAETKAKNAQATAAKKQIDAQFVELNKPSYMSKYGSLLGDLEIATSPVSTKLAAVALYDHVASADPRLVPPDHFVTAARRLTESVPKAQLAQATERSAIKTNEAIRFITSRVNLKQDIGPTAFDKIGELRDIVNIAELSGFHTPVVINGWYEEVDNLAETVLKNNMATVFDEYDSELQGIISQFEFNAANGIVDAEFLTGSLAFIDQLTQNFTTEFNATAAREAKLRLTRSHSTSIATTAFQALADGTDGKGIDPAILAEAISIGSAGIDSVNNRYGNTNTTASNVARTISQIVGTPAFASNLATIVNEIEQRNNDLWEATTAAQDTDDAMARVKNGTGSPDDAEVYAEEILGALVDGPINYQDPLLWSNELGQLTPFSQEFINLANLGHLPKSFKNLMVSVATGGITANESVFNVINALNNANTNGKPINILTQMPNLTDQETEAAVRLSFAQDLAEFSQQTVSEALATILGRESEMKMSINDYSKDVLDAKIPEWVAKTWLDADLKSRALLRFATKEAFIQGASTAEDVKSRVQYYIDNHFVEDDKVIGAGVDGKVIGGRQLLPNEIVKMNNKIESAIIQSATPEEAVKFLKVTDLAGSYAAGTVVSAAVSLEQTIRNVITGDRRLDLNWKLQPDPSRYGNYYLMIKTEAGTYVQRTVDVETEGGTVKVPMSFDVVDYRGTRTSDLDQLYSTQYKNSLKANGITSFAASINAGNKFLALEGFGLNGSEDEVNAKAALVYVRNPSLLKEDKHKQIFFDLVDDGWINEAHVPLFFEEVDGIQPFARTDKITRESAAVGTEIKPDDPPPLASIPMVMNNFKLNMRNTTEAEWKAMSKDERSNAGLPQKLPIPAYFITGRFFKPTPQSSNWRKNFHRALTMGDAMSLYTRQEWDSMDESERISKGLPLAGIDVNSAGGNSQFKQGN